MLISIRWLKRHVDLDGISPEEVAHDLTIHTAEVEGLEPFAPWLGDVVVGHVTERQQHPNADKLSLCKVDLGDDEPLQIVCGASNVDQGQRVAVGRVGVVLPGDLRLKKAKIRGTESQGMICSVRELALGEEHDGIWVLPEDAPIGEPVSDALDLRDWVIEIDNKSLTHRPDLWGHRGIARELAAIRKLELKPLDFTLPQTGAGAPYPVSVETSGCPRYLGLPIDGVENGPSPDWLRFLLFAVDQRPIDLLVDLSNFVMLDLGQPNHLFDRKRLSADGITVRNAREGEAMATLDEVERRFGPEDMLICSGEEPVAIAGVMGGEASKVTPETTDLLLEVASFHPTLVRRTAARLGLRTDASARFEKHLDPTLPAKAAAHLVNLLREMQPRVSFPQPAGDAGDWQDPATTIALRPERLREVLGAEVSDEEIERTLAGLDFGVSRADPWSVAVPSERATKDIGIEEDLIEEVGRMFGYGRIAERPLTGEIVPPPRDERRLLVRTLQDRLSGPARFHEAMTHTFQSDELLKSLSLTFERHVEVVNPIIDGLSCIRRSVLPSLVGLLPSNRRQRADVRLYEIGKGYLPEEANERGEPRELHQVALVWARPRPAKNARFDDSAFAHLRGVVEDLIRCAGRVRPAYERGVPDEAPSFVHPGKWVVGAYPSQEGSLLFVGELEPGLARELGLTGELDCDVAVARLSIDHLLQAPTRPSGYRPIPRFPGVKVDVAFSLPEETPAAEVVKAIQLSGKGLVESVELFDLYRGEAVGAGRKSLAYHVVLQSPDKTLTDKDAAKFLGRVERAAEKLGGELRKD